MATGKTHTPRTAGLGPARPSAGLRVGSPALALGRRDGVRSLLVFLAVALLLLAADVALRALHPGDYRVAIGNYRDEFFFYGANDQEVAPDGRSYRWTTGESTLVLGQLGARRDTILTLELGGRPEPTPLELSLNGRPWLATSATTDPRHLRLLLPPDHADSLRIGIRSETFSNPGDSRRLGVKVEGFRVTFPGSGLALPNLSHYLSQLALVLAVQLTAIRLGLGWRGQAIVTAPIALALAALLSGALLLADDYLSSLAVASALLAGLTWLALPQAERLADIQGQRFGDRREIRILWAIMLAACAIRLLGMLYPTFDGQDLGRNVRRQLMTLTGQMYIISGSAEFAKGQTIYPTGPYLFLMPGMLFSADVGKLIETVLTILEGTTTFFVALLARRLGGGRDAGRIAAILFLGAYASFSVHVFQFSAQIFGQWLTAPIALLLLAGDGWPSLRRWSLAILVLLFGIYSHIGVAILGISWMGAMLLLALLGQPRVAWRAIAVLVAAVVGALFFMYLDIAAITVSHTSSVLGRETGGGALLPGATPLLVKGLRLAYTDIGLALLPFGLLLLALRHRRLDRLFVPLGALVTVLFYLAVDLAFKLQVRYFYFALPLAMAVIAYTLGELARSYPRWGRVSAWALALSLAVQGVALWFSTAFGDGQISMTPLTH